MKITCLTTFLDGKERFEKDDVRTVEDERGAYFVAQGWASTEGTDTPAPAGGDVDLAVQDGVMGQETING